LSSFIPVDMTGAPTEWGSYLASIFIDPSLEGHILQIGFLNTATAYEGSGVLYDNVNFGLAPLSASLDIKPGSCPNPINNKSRGVLPAALLGTGDLDINDIDVASLQLEGVAPLRWDYEDVAGPFEDGPCSCTEAGPDDYLDLTLKFKTQDLIDAIGPSHNGEVALTLTGALLDGTPIEGQDCVIFVGGRRETLGIDGRGRPELQGIRAPRRVTFGAK
jgi:hypothetical protein